MYDEFDNKENEDRYDPKQPSAEDEVKTGQMYGEEDQLSETEEVQASTAEETEASAESGEQSSVYHYSYERGEQAEPTGSTQNSQQYGSSEHHAEEHINEEKKGYRQYYQNGEYHQREDGWHDGVYQKSSAAETFAGKRREKAVWHRQEDRSCFRMCSRIRSGTWCDVRNDRFQKIREQSCGRKRDYLIR